MKESHGKDPASHPDPESCVGGRKDAGEALTGAHAGQPSSCEIRSTGVPTPLSYAEGNTVDDVTGKSPSDPAQSEIMCMRGNSPHGKREIPRVPAGGKVDRPEKVYDRTSGAHDRVVPEKPPNNDGDDPSAEAVEGRRSTEGNTMRAAASRTQSRLDALNALDRVREAARRDRRARFTLRTVIRNSYKGHYRRMVPQILQALDFRSNNRRHRPVIQALDLLKRYADTKLHTFPCRFPRAAGTSDQAPQARALAQTRRCSTPDAHLVPTFAQRTPQPSAEAFTGRRRASLRAPAVESPDAQRGQQHC
jgi:hypothetical protein